MKNYIILLYLIICQFGFSQITDTGNKVGIGVSSPAAKLHVYESSALGSNFGNYQRLSTISGNVGNSLMENNWLLRKDGGSDWYSARVHNGLSIDVSFVTPGVDTRTWWEREPSTGNQFWGNGSSTHMSIVGGNLGIRTSTPDGRLDVFGNNPNSTNLILSANYENAHRWRFNTTDRGNAIDMDITSSDGSDNQEIVLKLSRSNSGRPEFQLYNDVIVANNGNVGIGTLDTKGFRLGVQGKIVAEEVKVAIYNNWADFVFDNSYDLPSLQEVEQHIIEKGHLKDIPSAKEAKKTEYF